jgi:hypothetical protein
MSLGRDFVTVPGQLFALISIVGPECPQKNDLLALKIRGCFNTRFEATEHAGRLQKADGSVNIYVVDMYQWLPIPPNDQLIEDVHYSEEKLEEIFTKFRENQAQGSAFFEKRKRDMMAKPLTGVDTPYIDPSDENSKYYTRPDVPAAPHPSDFLEELKVKYPSYDHALAKLADECVKEVIAQRAAAEVEEPPAQAPRLEVIDETDIPDVEKAVPLV